MENISVILFTVNRSQLYNKYIYYSYSILKLSFHALHFVFKNRVFIGFNYET